MALRSVGASCASAAGHKALAAAFATLGIRRASAEEARRNA
ncbi:hypothetical protein [Albidovulum sp.]